MLQGCCGPGRSDRPPRAPDAAPGGSVGLGPVHDEDALGALVPRPLPVPLGGPGSSVLIPRGAGAPQLSVSL